MHTTVDELTDGRRKCLTTSWQEEGEVAVLVVEGQKGFWTLATALPLEEIPRINAAFGVDDEMAEAMKVGSMFGWDVPGAKPEKYHWITEH